MPFSPASSFLGIAKQPVQGTAVAATDFMVLNSEPRPVDTIAELADRSYRGSAVAQYGSLQGRRVGALALDGDLDLGTIGYPLQALLPDLVASGTNPYTSVFATKNSGGTQGGGYTFTDYTAFETRLYSDGRFSELTIAFSPLSLVTFSAKVASWASTGGAARPSAVFPATAPLPAYLGVVTIDGTSAVNVISGSITIKRPVDIMPNINGAQDPAVMWQGIVSVVGKLSFVYENNTELNRYLTNVQPPLDIRFTQGSSSLTLHSSVTAFGVTAVNRRGAFTEIDTTFSCLGNTTDAGATGGSSPLKATLVNTRPSGTYA